MAAAASVVLAVAVILGAIAPGLAALVVLPLALALFLPLIVAPFAARAAARAADATGVLRAEAVEPLTAMEDILAANAEPRAVARVEEAARRMDSDRRRLTRAGSLGAASGTVLTQAALLGALAWGIAGGSAEAGAVVVSLFLVLAAMDALGALPRAGAALALAAAGARRLLEDGATRSPCAAFASPGTRSVAPSSRTCPWTCRRARESRCSGPPASASRPSRRCC
jgi:ATP-binding cassette subfamily C protein CydC